MKPRPSVLLRIGAALALAATIIGIDVVISLAAAVFPDVGWIRWLVFAAAPLPVYSAMCHLVGREDAAVAPAVVATTSSVALCSLYHASTALLALNNVDDYSVGRAAADTASALASPLAWLLIGTYGYYAFLSIRTTAGRK